MRVRLMFLLSWTMPPVRKTPLTPSKRGRILQLRKLGWDYRSIAKEIGCAPSTALYTQQREDKYHTRNDLPRSGRPRVIDNRTERRVIREIKMNRFKPYKYILEVMPEVTERQVHGIANAAGYRRRVARRKPFLSSAAIKKRLQWAKDNTGRDWNQVI